MMTDKFNEKQGILLQGYIKITDPTTGEVLVDKRNAIHYENMSISLADSLSNQGQGMIYQMAFGNGGTTVDPTGIITYLSPNSTGTNASLYNQTYQKVIDDNSCKEGSIIGGLLGAGLTMSATRGKDRWWAVPAGGTAGALIGCQIDGG